MIRIVISSVLLVVWSLAWMSCTPAESKPFEDTRIVMFVGGKPGSVFTRTIKRGATEAEDALGCSVKYVWSDWNSDTMLQQFKDAIYEKPDAICVMGHPGEEAMRPLIEEAYRKGIVVTILNADLPGIKQDYIAKGCGYAGQNTYQSGYQLGEALAKEYGNEPRAALVYTWDYTPDQQLSHRARRSQGIIDALKHSNFDVVWEDMPESIKANCTPQELQDYLQATLKKYPETYLLVADSGHITAMLPAAMKASGITPGEIVAAGFDLSAATITGIQDGYLGIVHDQQPYLQGFLPVLQACLSCKYGFSGLNINTGSGLIDETSLDLNYLLKLVQQDIR